MTPLPPSKPLPHGDDPRGSTRADSSLPGAGAVLGGLLLSAAAGVLGLELGARDHALAAAPAGGSGSNSDAGDSDFDGLGNLAEILLGTDPLDSDSDNDGYSDLEEVALGSDPMLFEWNLDTSVPSVGIATATNNGFVVSRIAVYLPGGNLATLDLSIGVVVKVFNGTGDSYVPLTIPSDFYISNGTLTIFDAPSTPGDRVVVVDLPVPQSYVEAVGWLPVYAVATVLGVPGSTAAADTIVISHGVPYVVEEPLESMAQVTSGGGGGVIYRPLLPPDDMPPTSTQGEICYQDVEPVGIVGGVVQYQVQQSDCLPADSYCSSNCQGMVGGSIDVYDPLLLIGG